MDFGMTKRIPPDWLEHEKAAIRAGLRDDPAGVRAELGALGFFRPEDRAIDSEKLLAYVRTFHDWHAQDQPFTFTRDYVAQLVTMATPGSPNWQLEKHLSVPPNVILSRRLETLTLGALGQLETTANWHRIMGELLDDSEPADELGSQEAAFFGPALQVRPRA
jgi:hypothetical protein